MRRKSIDIVAENIIKERKSRFGITHYSDGYTVVGNRFRFIRTCNDITTECNAEMEYDCMPILENCADKAKEIINLPTLKEIDEKVKAIHAHPEYKRGTRIVYNADGVCVNIKYLVDAIKAVKDDGGEIKAVTWKDESKGYKNPLLITTTNYKTHCVVLPIIACNVMLQPVGTYSFEGKFNTRVVM